MEKLLFVKRGESGTDDLFSLLYSTGTHRNRQAAPKSSTDITISCCCLTVIVSCRCGFSICFLFILSDLQRKSCHNKLNANFFTFESIGGQNFMLLSTYLTFYSLEHKSTWSRSTDFL